MKFVENGDRFNELAGLSNQKLCSYVTLMRDELSPEDQRIIHEIVDERLSQLGVEFDTDLERVRLELQSIT